MSSYIAKNLLPHIRQEVVLDDPKLDDSIHRGDTPFLPSPTPLSELERIPTPVGVPELEFEVIENSDPSLFHMGRIGRSSFNKAISKLIDAGFPKDMAETIVENRFFHQMEVMSKFAQDPQRVISELSKQMQKIREALDGMEKQKIEDGTTSYFKGTFYGPDGNLHEVHAEDESALIKEAEKLYISLIMDRYPPAERTLLNDLIHIEENAKSTDTVNLGRNIAKYGFKYLDHMLEAEGVDSSLSELGGSFDLLVPFNVLSGLFALKKAVDIRKKIEVLDRQITSYQENEDFTMVSILQKKRKKLMHQSMGFFMTGSCKTTSSLFSTGAGIAAFCSLCRPDFVANASLAGGVCSVAGACLGVIGGACAMGLYGRNFSKAASKKKEISHFMDYMLKVYGFYPHTESEVILALRLCEMHMQKQETKMCQSSLGFLAGSATVAGASCSIGAALGPETIGIGSAVCAAVGLSVIVAKLAHSKYVDYNARQREEWLRQEGRYQETELGLYCGLYFQILNELSAKESTVEGESLPIPKRIFTETVAPMLLGMSGEDFIRLVKDASLIPQEHDEDDPLNPRTDDSVRERLEWIFHNVEDADGDSPIGSLYRSGGIKMYAKERQLWLKKEKALKILGTLDKKRKSEKDPIKRKKLRDDYLKQYQIVSKYNRQFQSLREKNQNESQRCVKILGEHRPQPSISHSVSTVDDLRRFFRGMGRHHRVYAL